MDRVTIRDVARAAGVSHPVVSAVLGQSKSSTVRVSQDTRTRVLKAAKELNYTPSFVGRGLRQNRSYLTGVLISDVNWMIAVDLMRGIQESMLERQYSMAVHIHDSLESETKEAQQLIERRVDGLLVNCWAYLPHGARREWPAETTIPRIELLGNYLRDAPSVEVDFRADAAAAVGHLLGQGHRHIALVTHSNYGDRKRFPTASEFAEGYCEALDRAGLTPQICCFQLRGIDAWETQCVAAGEGMLAQLSTLVPRPTAVVCFNDYCAYGLLRAAQAAGLNVPDELSIMGHFDADMAALTYPGLTTLRIPTREIGRAAGEMLFASMGGESVASRKLSSALVTRNSTAPPRNA